MVSASDWHAGGTGLIPRRSKPVIFGIQSIDNWRCNVMRHEHWHAWYIKFTRMSYRPRYHYTTVDLCVYRRDKYASASIDLGGKKEKTKESGTHISLRSTTSPSWNLTSHRNEVGASAVLSLRHSSCVVVFRVRAIITACSRTLASDAIQFP